MTHIVDRSLLRKIKKHGAGRRLDVDACFQCGNCTAVCPLAEDSGGFPRRIIRMAQMGMEKELLASEDIWRCYACGECTQTCPRQADPAEFMAATRSYAISRYDFTGLAALANRSVLGNLLVFALFSVVFSLLLVSAAQAVGPQAPLFNFIPGHWIHDIGVVLFVIVGLSAVLGMFSMTARFVMQQRRKGAPLRLGALPGAIVSAITDALMHRRFQRCDSAEATPPPPAEPWYLRPWVVHAAVMGGFLTMLLATTLDFLFKPIGSPVPPWYPMRIMGLVGGLVCLYGLVIIFQRRIRASQVPWKKSSFSDWFFPSLLAATVLTGILTELAVYAPLGYVGHAIFFTHVVLAMDLVAMLPLTKFAHVLYRTLALTLFAWRHAPVPEHVVAKAQV